ncbi:hypothetical protein K458DRAFT_71831 [Lentithecium fluviatile CBS 122367]|uniref:Uncharacterized protein n=1 Tax=Lentithecium fluviatile CBS 122367 TaxID=1168545 RepID=A0A6G1IV07_9PLEO|nr:hypothetical protein K458DRAFT_71831 [Lentithecium fluviatile CBS 122367]
MRANRANSIVSVTFTDGGRHHFSLNNSELRDDYHFRSQLDELLHLNDSSLQRLDAEHCIMAYSEIPQTERSHVLLVSPTSSSNSSEYNVTVNLVEQFDSGSNADPFDWICRDVDTLTSCSDMVDMMRRNASNWQPFGRRVSYCLSYMQPGGCAVNFSVHIAVTIIVFNLAKLMLLLVVIFGMQHRPLLTTGDAITSFLARPDQFTQDCCLLDQNDVRSAHSRWPVVMARRWTTRRYFRGKAAGAWRWGVCLAMQVILWLDFSLRNASTDRRIRP